MAEQTSVENVKTGALMPLVSLRKHYKVGLIAAGLIVLLGLPFAWFKGKALYAATAVIYVAPQFANILKESKELELPSYQQYKLFVDQQARTVNRYDIMLESLERLGPLRKLWQKEDESDRRAAERLQAELRIRAVPDTYLIGVTLESHQVEGLESIVNTVVKTYVEKVGREEIFFGGEQRLNSLFKRRSRVIELVEELEARRLELSQELGVTTFVDNAFNPFDQLLSDSRQAYAEAKRKRLQAEAALRVYENPEQPEKARISLDAEIADIMSKDAGLSSLKANLFERKSKLLQDFSGLNASHPLYLQIKQKLEDMDAEVVTAAEKLSQSTATMLIEQRRSVLNMTTQIEQELSNQITEQNKRATWFASRYNEALNLSRELNQYYREMDSIENRITFLTLESEAPGHIRIDSLARPPEIPIGGGRKKLFIMVCVLAVIVGLGLPIGIDILDSRIKTPGQVHKLLGYKPLAVTLENADHLGGDLFSSDQIRRALLALERERQQKGYTILLTSVKHGSYTTSMAMMLALEYHEFGVTSIVVEVNPVSPDAMFWGNKKRTGLLNMILDNNQNLDDVIVPADGNLPDRLGLGLPTDGQLYAYDALKKAIAQLQQRYDVVILDAAPLLISADAEYFAGFADITLMLIKAMDVRPGELKRAAGILEKANPKAVGFIVTGVQAFGDGGYFADNVKIYNEQQQNRTHLFARYFDHKDS